MAQVLVVDDHHDGRDVVSRFLRLRGHQPTGAADGQEALSKLLTDRPDVMILDVRMPNLDGLALLEVLRSYLRWTKMPVILLTAEATPEELRKARDLGVNHVFHKAMYDLNELVAAVDECVPN
jgi:CheY-like chemotaxis protein